MRIEITIENDKWLRADLVHAGARLANLYHVTLHPSFPIMQQYMEVADNVRFHYPKHANLEVVTDIGASGSL